MNGLNWGLLSFRHLKIKYKKHSTLVCVSNFPFVCQDISVSLKFTDHGWPLSITGIINKLSLIRDVIKTNVSGKLDFWLID